MHNKQQITPKYWMFHTKTSDDVFVLTASKCYNLCVEKAKKLYPDMVEEYFALEDTNYMFSLFEINLCY
jgi:hypothetical protein